MNRLSSNDKDDTSSLFTTTDNRDLSSPLAHTNLDRDFTLWSSSVTTFLEQPPAKFPARLLVGMLIFSLSFILWAWFGRVDRIGTAVGKLIPQGETYRVQPVESGKVVKVDVKEGQIVQKGQVLVELDARLAYQQVQRLQQILTSQQQQLSQKQALLSQAILQTQTNLAISAADSLAQQDAIAQAQAKQQTTQQLLTQQQSELNAYRLRNANLQPLSNLSNQQLNELRAEQQADRERLNRLIPLVKRGAISQEYVFQARQSLQQIEQQITQSQMQALTGASEQQFQAEQQLQDFQANLTQNQGELASNRTQIKQLQAQLNQKRAQAKQTQLQAQENIEQIKVEISQLQGQISDTNHQLATAKTQLQENFLKAPVAGTISSLNLQNTGEDVSLGQTIVEIAPQGKPLILSAILPNSQAGFVKIGMTVKVKLDAYPYQEYGVIPGRVISLSADSQSNEQLGQVYQVKIALKSNYLVAHHQDIPFKAGETATAEIIVRHYRIADLLLSPFQKFQKDGIAF